MLVARNDFLRYYILNKNTSSTGEMAFTSGQPRSRSKSISARDQSTSARDQSTSARDQLASARVFSGLFIPNGGIFELVCPNRTSRMLCLY